MMGRDVAEGEDALPLGVDAEAQFGFFKNPKCTEGHPETNASSLALN